MTKEDDQFSLAETFSSPWASIPWIIGSALAAGATPGTARLAGGANVGLQSMMGLERQAAEKRKRERLSQSLDKLASLTTPVTKTKYGIDPKQISFEDPERRLSAALTGRPRQVSIREQDVTSQPRMPSNRLAPRVPLPTYEATEQKPLLTPVQREYLKAIAPYDSSAAATLLGNVLTREPQKPIAVRPGGVLVDPQSGQEVYKAPPTSAREATPPRPVFSTQGGEAVDSVYNPQTRQWETQRRPLTRPPAAPTTAKTPEELERIRSATALNRARIQQVQNSIEIARTAKTQTTGQLAATLTALDNITETGSDPKRAEFIEDAKTRVLQELARRTPEQQKDRQLTAEAKSEMRKTAPNMSDSDFQIYVKTDRGAQNLEKWKEHVRTRGQTGSNDRQGTKTNANDPLGIRGNTRRRTEW